MNILHIDSGITPNSASRELTQRVVDRLQAQGPAQVTYHDLHAKPIEHLTADALGFRTGQQATTQAERDQNALSEQLVSEFLAADTIVIGAPMYNFGIPSTLKSWFDYVLRAGITFSYSEAGPEGLLKNKRAIVVESRGGLYSSGPAQSLDSQEPHLRTMLGFAGITDVTFIRAEKLGYGPEAREEAIRNANAELALVA